jgi:hypothetical protein
MPSVLAGVQRACILELAQPAVIIDYSSMGFGGFFLPSVLGAIKDSTGSYGPGLLLLALGFAAGALALLHLGSVWTSRWQPDIVSRSGVFCYKVAVRGSGARGSAL